MQKDYYIGLDVGTNSVGWAVTDERYNLVKAPVKGKYKNHDMWGIRLFEDANTAAQRRAYRSNRRRLQRKVGRIKLLQELFSEEIAKVDPTFFLRLNDSKLHPEDKSEEIKSEKHPLFIENAKAEKEYYEKYPTIYHLRKELIDSSEPHDIRLVYLAIHHILKNRGHFLREGNFTDATDFEKPFESMLQSLNDMKINIKCLDKNVVKKILSNNKLSNSRKQAELKDCFSIIIDNEQLTSSEEKILQKKNKSVIAEITKLLAGNKGALSKIFDNVPEDIDGDKTAIKLSESKYEDEFRDKLFVEYPDEINCVDRIKEIYDWSVLQEILPNETKYISNAMVELYNKHKSNLDSLKKNIFKNSLYFADEDYNDFFRKDTGNSYVNYVGHLVKNGKKVTVGKCTEEIFYSTLKKKLDKVKSIAEENNDEEFLRIYNEVECYSLLPLQRSKNNGVIPRQVHEHELKKILDNASKYLDFLNEVDEQATSLEDKTTKGKIISIFEYRIPYYVGPLSLRHKSEKKGRQVGSNTWIVRKAGMENTKIYPWNFNEVVDKEKCNEEFIERMTNKCTYLVGEDVLPKNSLLYKKYMVLNELNNLKVYGKDIDVQTKQRIYNELFKKKSRVTGLQLLKFLQIEMNDPKLQKENLSGFDGDFANNLSSYLDFKKNVFNDTELTYEQELAVETIIKWITIYGDDSSMIGTAVKNHYGDMFSAEQIKKIKRLRYSGWGNFSKKFLTEIKGGIIDEAGNANSIIDSMWISNENLMQLLSNKYDFNKLIEENNSMFSAEVDKITYENVVEDLYVSPASKRAIWQTIQIVEEIQKIMKYPAKKIFVEMARGGEKDKKRTTSRKKHLIELYSNCEKDVRDWALEDIESREEREFSSKKLYLYYLQQGKCAYTGNPITLADLMAGNTKWDIDHIYPQSKIKDDSFNNLVLVERQVNAKKNNEMLASSIQDRMESTWFAWYKNGFITKEKFDRLTRKSDFSDDELAGFIARQLVETRQTTKVVADVMKQLYTTAGTKIVYVKAALTSDFRKFPLNVLKSRRVNDFHHAKDAYLNIVVGDIYNTKFTNDPWKWMKKHREDIDSGKISLNKVMCFDVINKYGEVIWEGCDKYKSEDGKNHFVQKEDPEIPGNTIIVGGDIDRIRSIVRKDTCMYTEYTYCQQGVLFNATHKRKGDSSAKIPLKSYLSMEKYGGYNSATTSYFALVEFDGKKSGERVKNIIGVPIYVANMLEHNHNAFIEYCEGKGMKNVKVLRGKIKKNALIIANGFPMRIRGENEKNNMLKSNLQLKISIYLQEQIRRIEKLLEKNINNIEPEHDGITEESLDDIYYSFCEKLESGQYSNRPSNQVKTLIDAKDEYTSLLPFEKSVLLNSILNLFRCDNDTTANLKPIDGSPSAGKIDVNKNTICKNKVVLVNQSVTGLYESREIL